ncbi:MAG: hypothetical protein A3G21_18410 [Acidobacteria bacterium RIFCSPLOWO2_12_FULL_66_21]|nr:MAG: hypothetical protein A3G21_18410 [Acidobacteria bacterium RIFCSPLOWO2_12_FULL_66_21]
MRGRFRLPLVVVAVALLGLIVLLATLQYRWVGQVSSAERDRMRASLATRASEFAQDFDRELTRAFLLFQAEGAASNDELASRLAVRHDRWQATARFPRLVKDIYVVSRDPGEDLRLQRFNPASRALETAEWPSSMSDWREQFGTPVSARPGDDLLVTRMASPVWERVPALVLPMMMVVVTNRAGEANVRFAPQFSFMVIALDSEYMAKELLPALATQHFRGTGDGFDYQLAVVNLRRGGEVYASTPSLKATADTKADAQADFFRVRAQDFGTVAAEIRRFTTFTTTVGRGSVTARQAEGQFEMRTTAPLSIILQKETAAEQSAVSAGAAFGAAARRLAGGSAPRWRLLVKHPSGSLETAVNAVRRRNLIVSTSILVVLGASVGLLVLSTRRAQELARQRMEFVAAVSHELRTPLAVIRSAGDNLADGVVHDEERIRTYGDLVRNEGRRLTEMVEQILEFAGIESGQRGFALGPVGLAPLLREVAAQSATLLGGHLDVEFDLPESLPPVLGDEPALRRLIQNLVGNAIKYGAGAGWIGVRARHVAREVEITIADRGIGIPEAEQKHIFEPFYRAPEVIAAQIQGAGLGLSLVRRIVRAHAGRIAVHSVPGRGSEFVVTLPAAAEPPLGRQVEAPSRAPMARETDART